MAIELKWLNQTILSLGVLSDTRSISIISPMHTGPYIVIHDDPLQSTSIRVQMRDTHIGIHSITGMDERKMIAIKPCDGVH